MACGIPELESDTFALSIVMDFLEVGSPERGGHVLVKLIEYKARGEAAFADSHRANHHNFDLIQHISLILDYIYL